MQSHGKINRCADVTWYRGLETAGLGCPWIGLSKFACTVKAMSPLTTLPTARMSVQYAAQDTGSMVRQVPGLQTTELM
jgi:hypothetical protein